MNIRKLKDIILLFLILFSNQVAFSQENQDTTTLWAITTTDGNEYIGKILKEDAKEIQFETINIGIIMIAVANIKSRGKIDKENMIGNELWFENPQSTRYFWAPNGYGLKKGEGYYQNIMILANQVSYGFSDHFTMGLGTIPLFLFADIRDQTPFWITPKFSIPINKDKTNIGVGALIGGAKDLGFGALFFSSFTFGSRDNNVSLNIGYGKFDGGWSNSPTISICGMKRVSRRTYLLTENYYIGGEDEDIGIISFGARTVWDKISLDYGLFAPIVEYNDGFIALPWIGFSLPMGKLRRGN